MPSLATNPFNNLATPTKLVKNSRATKTFHQVVASAQASFPPRNKKGFAYSSEVSDQNNIVGLRTSSKHKIGSIGGKGKSKDQIRFEVG